MSSDFGEAEAQRRHDARVRTQNAIRSKIWEQRKARIFTSVKRGITLLFATAIVCFAFSNREGIEKIVSSHLNHIVATRTGAATSNKLRQGAVAYEQAVDQITQQ